MQDVIANPGTLLDGMPDSHETRLSTIGKAGNVSSRATAHSHDIRLGWHVQARDLHPGDVVRQCDWPLHVSEVTLSPTAVAVAVTEFGFPLHYAADEQVQLVA